MNTRFRIKSLFLAFIASMLSLSGLVNATAVIDSLDFGLTGSDLFDCEVLSKINLERDPLWSDVDYFIRLVEQYETKEGEYDSVEAFREYVQEEIRTNWSAFYTLIYEDYASRYYEDFYDREEYYATYNESLKESYYYAYLLRNSAIDESSLSEIMTYDVFANYCSSENPIRTTYDYSGGYPTGYVGFVKLGEREVNLSEETLSLQKDGYIYHEDGFGELKLELSRIDNTTIKATYRLKNLSGSATNYGLAYYADIYFGGNDDAAISKTNRGFTITQDDPHYSSSFGAQFHIELDPLPTTTYVGYYGDAEDYHWENSAKQYYTAEDDEDTGLAYSWQGTIADGETKTFSATYTIKVVNTFINYFYFMGNNYTVPDEINSVDGGALRLPSLDFSTRQGYHREWNTKRDATGESFESGITIIANELRNTYYEVEVPNIVTPIVKKGDGVISEQDIVITDEMRERYKDKTESSYDNYRIGVLFKEDYNNEKMEQYEEEGNFTKEDTLKPLDDKYIFSNLLFFDGMGKYYIDEEGNAINEDFEADEFPITIRMKLSDEMREGKADFKVTYTVWNEDLEKFENFVVVPSTYNFETGELFFEFDGPVDEEEIRIYALSYAEIPDVPNAGNNTKSASLKGNILLTAFASFILFSLCYRKFATRSIE